MSRADKERRRRLRKERAGRRERRPALPPGVRLFSYDITYDRLDTEIPGTRGIETAVTEDEGQLLYEQCYDAPRDAVARLETLIASHPDVPTLYNWLAVAHLRAGDKAAYERAIELNYERHPNYLFALVGHLQLLLERGKVDEADRVLNKRYDLKLLYPDRDVFHVTEYRAFAMVLAEVFIRTNRREPAEVVYKGMLQLLGDDDDAVRKVSGMINIARLRDAIQTIPGRVRRTLPY